MIPCEVADGLVLAELAPALLLDAAALAAGARRRLERSRSEEDERRERERARLGRRREAAERELAGYRRMLALEQVTEAEYRADRARCLADIAEADAALAALGEGPAPVADDGLARVAGRLVAIGQLWPATTVEERRAFLADLGLQVWRHADRIEVRWPPDVAAILHGA